MLPRRGAPLPSVLANLRDRVAAWWIMVAVLAVALVLGETATVVLFYLLSLLALREFITISPTHQKDHKTLVWVFFVVPLVHYFFVWKHLYGMFAVFIPVYVFLFLPARNALVGEKIGRASCRERASRKLEDEAAQREEDYDYRRRRNRVTYRGHIG